MKELPEASITINGRPLSNLEARTFRLALQFARRDMEAAPNDLLAAGLLKRVDDMLALIDDTEVTL